MINLKMRANGGNHFPCNIHCLLNASLMLALTILSPPPLPLLPVTDLNLPIPRYERFWEKEGLTNKSKQFFLSK